MSIRKGEPVDVPTQERLAEIKAEAEERLAAAKATVKKTKIKTEDLPIVADWVLASEAADIAGVSRQYLHNCAGEFDSASQLSGFLAFRREEIVAWAASRVERFAQP